MKFIVLFIIYLIRPLIFTIKIKKSNFKKIPILIGDDCIYSEKNNECNNGLSCHKFKLVCLLKNGEICFNSSDCLTGYCNKITFKCGEFSKRLDIYF